MMARIKFSHTLNTDARMTAEDFWREFFRHRFWDRCHRTSDIRWLTGSKLHDICDYHKMPMPRSLSVAEIGVGTGVATMTLHARANRVIGIDVSRTALERVRPFCAEQHLSQNIAEMSACDLAILHLVVQHCPDDEVERLVRGVRLKPDGVLSIQGAYSHVPNPPDVSFVMHYRPLSRMIAIVHRAGRIVKDAFLVDRRFDDYPHIGWWIVKVVDEQK
jgi:SAM-dependent methyltransferase